MSNYDWVFYANFYTDIKAANINTEEKALEHYTSHGAVENRRTHLDVERYLKNSEVYGETLFSSINDVSFYGISQHFLMYVIKECKLSINANVAEIGSGIACLSLPIIKHIKQGKYLGLDTNKACIEWCRRKISPYCDATFRHVTNNHFIIPCDDNELDMVYSTTVFLALPIDDVNKYLMEINRVLKKGGHLIITVFLWNHTTQFSLKTKKIKTRILRSNGNVYLVNCHGEQANVYNDTTIYALLETAHYEIKEIIFGHWNDTSNSGIYQDIIHAVKIK